MSEILQSKIVAVRRKQVVVAVATGIAAALGAFVLLLALSMLLDFWLNLSFTVRAALLAVNLAAVVSILLYSIFVPLLYGPDDDEIALMVEDAEPAFRTRLIASIQLSRPSAAPAGASTSLIRAMVAQAESLAGPMDFGRVIKTDALVRIIVLSLTICVVVGGACAWGREVSGDLLKRALFLSDTPVPRKTRVTALTGSPLMARGDNIEIFALADGVYPPERAHTVYIKTLSADKSATRKQELTLEPVTLDKDRIDAINAAIDASGRTEDQARELKSRIEKSTSIFSGKLENLQEPFEYTVRLNDGESPLQTVNVLPRPAITKITVHQEYPAYTGLPPKERALGDLNLLRGSKLQLSVTANKPLRGPTAKDAMPNRVHLLGSNIDAPLVLDPSNPNQITGQVELPKGTTGFLVRLTDSDGLTSKDEAVYRIDLIEDRPPTVRILFPDRKEIVLVQQAVPDVIFQAIDDFAVAAAAIKFKVDDSPEETIALDLKGLKPKTFPGRYKWKLADIRPAGKPIVAPLKPLAEGSVIEYWVEAQDNRDAANGGPNKGVSEHYMIRIGSKEEVLGIIKQRMADIGSALHTATDDQDAVADKVKAILLEKGRIAST